MTDSEVHGVLQENPEGHWQAVGRLLHWFSRHCGGHACGNEAAAPAVSWSGWLEGNPASSHATILLGPEHSQQHDLSSACLLKQHAHVSCLAHSQSQVGHQMSFSLL